MRRTLAIEASCDDTSIAVIEENNGYFSVVAMKTNTQTLHNEYGGVVPELAYRKHAECILGLIEDMWWKELIETIESITVTGRPWLPWWLLIWINVAHTLWILRDKPVIEVNHVMWHVFSILLDRAIVASQLPYVCLTVSGGHSDIYIVELAWHEQDKSAIVDDFDRIKRQHLWIWEEIDVWVFHVTKLWQTRDDAAWEAFDKVARMLWWPYPWWAWIGGLAVQWSPNKEIIFREATLEDGTFDMSFSWLKSQVYNVLRKFRKLWINIDDQLKADIAYAFQETITTMLVKKVIEASEKYNACVVWLVGWVAANARLREKMNQALEANVVLPMSSCVVPNKMVYCTDNAAMIGVVWLLETQRGVF